MKAIINDANILNQIQPQQLETYLVAKGWREHSRIPDKVTIWIRDTYATDKLKIQLPIDNNFDDYPLRISEVMDILEAAENRSQTDILSELIVNYSNLKITGLITAINTPNSDALNGEVLLLGMVFEKMQSVKLKLSDRDYILGIKAYQEPLPVACTGDLQKIDGVFGLENVRDFQIEQV